MNLIRRGATPLSTYRPSLIEDQFGRMVENMFEDMLSPYAAGLGGQRFATEGIATPRLNVIETEKAFEVRAEMPGVKKEDVKVTIESQRVTIEAEAKHESEQREGEQVVYSERSAQKFLRSFSLPADVDDAAAEAHMENGILTLVMPKKQGSAAKKLTVQ